MCERGWAAIALVAIAPVEWPKWELPLRERPLAATCEGLSRAGRAPTPSKAEALVGAAPGRDLGCPVARRARSHTIQSSSSCGSGPWPRLAFLKKNRIPEWVIAYLVGQTCSHWVHDNVLRNNCQIGIAMNMVLMVATRPHRVDGRRMHPDMARSRRFDSVHHSAQCIVLPQLNQPMCMIWHHNPCEWFCVTP